MFSIYFWDMPCKGLILIEIERPIGLKYFELWDYIEKLLSCEVDLVRAKLLREEIREGILKEVVSI